MKIGTGLMANGPLPRTSMKRAAMLTLGLAVVFAQVPGQAAQAPLPGDSLPYANGYLVTGGYVDGFVDLQQASGGGGFVSGTINLTGVPDQADVLAAWLYWETIVQTPSQLTGVEFRGIPIDVNDATVVKQSFQTLTGPFASCWASNGQQPTFTMYQMRADVRKLLPLQLDAQGFSTGKRLANGSHTVKLPENGTGNHVPQSAGGSLVVVYRDTRPANVREPLRKIVIYDGISVLPDLPGAAMSQTIRGIYKSESADLTKKFSKITHLGGSGQPNNSEQMFLYNGTANTPIATDPFGGTSSASDRSWSNKTVPVTSLMPGTIDSTYGETVTTSVNHSSGNPYDCLAWGAVIFETTEADADHDGIPDGIEDNVGALTDADGTVLPNIHAMTTSTDPTIVPSSSHPDIFIELDGMFANAGTTYGDPANPSTAPYTATLSPYSATVNSVTTTAYHSHLPTPEVLKGLIDGLTSGPTSGTNAGTVPHFDVGDPASYITALGSSYAPYFVPLAAQPKGGQLIEEKPCGLTTATDCKFHFFPGTVGWQVGYNAYAALMFDKNRNGLFHWVFYTHANGRSRSLLPCLDASNVPTGYGTTPGVCAVKANPNFNVPTTQSGVAQLPGEKVMVSVGLWDKVNHVGSTGVVTGTTLHELGHNLELYHGGFANTWNTTPQGIQIQREANCKPDYLSVMSYMFQMPGLLDDLGIAHYRYSKEVNTDLFENSIVDGYIGTTPSHPLPFRTAWYAPLDPLNPQMALFGSSVVTRYCSGARFGTTVPVDTVRLDGPLVDAKIDWLLNGITLDAVPLDVNFDGASNVSPIQLRGFSDWENLRLDQVGGGKGAFGYSSGSTGDGGGSTGDGGGSTGDGGGSTGDGGGSTGDGGGSTGDGGGSTGDGGGSTGDGGGVHMTVLGFAEMGHAPPNPLTACVIDGTGSGASCPGTAAQFHRVKLEWGVPPGDPADVARYHIYRWRDDDKSTVVEIPNSPTTATSLVDITELPHNRKFSYIVKADFTNGSKSGASVEKFITAINLAPAAVADTFAVFWKTTTTIPAPGVLQSVPSAPGYDTDDDSAHTSLKVIVPQVSGPSNGVLSLSATGAFTYTPNGSFFGNDFFSYQANNGTWTDSLGTVPMSPDSNVITVTIQVKKK